MKESDVIAYLKLAFPNDIGDDAAVLSPLTNTRWVISQDTLLEDIHFRTRYQTAESLAYKALQVNLSDLAAMGAKPELVLLALSFPSRLSEYTHQFVQAFATQCKTERVQLIGGDTTASMHNFYCTITVMGQAALEHIRYRTTAKPGEFICVAGNLGHAHLGFLALEKNRAGFEQYKHAFLNPTARIQEGLWLSKNPGVTAMMDISDGLYVDLQKLIQSSRVGASITLKTIALPSQSDCAQLGLDPIRVSLEGGEDYGLLFTVRPGAFEMLKKDFFELFGYNIHPVGKISETPGIQILDSHNSTIKIDLNPFEH